MTSGTAEHCAGATRMRRVWRSAVPAEDLVEKSVELVAAHLSLEFEPLNAGSDQAAAPVPRLELAQSFATEHDFVIEEREGGVPAKIGQPLELAKRNVDRALA